ncbi:phosphocarrier protein HPr [Crassaminicella indica]|uniref:Phosphocarrier protein HPr n=1 Tax=Crassaminicella indica TaxID=2855394 RepID=A0ABX8RHZ0_9CLOT|nr:phosphocarrier protein HPr [Crassaminicella indica]QXM07345.1 phosphocarrier protein HPr [Crassaminicella indica]
MMEKKVVIKNESGMHARPASMFVKTANAFKSDIEIELNGRKVNAKSIMGIMSLGIAKDSEITIIVNGEDEEQAIHALTELIENRFGES